MGADDGRVDAGWRALRRRRSKSRPRRISPTTIVMREASFTPPLSRDDRDRGATRRCRRRRGRRTTARRQGSTRDACEPLTNSADMDGRIALIERGGCEFQVKIANAEDAGAIAVVVYNDTDDPLDRHERRYGQRRHPGRHDHARRRAGARRSLRGRRRGRRRRHRGRARDGTARARHLRFRAERR